MYLRVGNWFEVNRRGCCLQKRDSRHFLCGHREDLFCGQPGATLGSLGSSLRVTLGHFGVPLERPWMIWGHSGGALGSLLVAVGRVWAISGHSKGTLGISLCRRIACRKNLPNVWEGCSKTHISSVATEEIASVAKLGRLWGLGSSLGVTLSHFGVPLGRLWVIW